MAKANTQQQAIDGVLERIREARNFDFRNYKRATLVRRIERRMHDRKCRTVAEYEALLERDASEFDQLVSAMLIKVTSFFRDAEVWDILASRIVPEILAGKRPHDEIRVWCAGCATGEEAYSIAILLAEALGSDFPNYDVKVFGTDVDEAAVMAARRGIYARGALEGIAPARLKRWFQPVPEGYLVRQEVRRGVVFGVNNLVSDAPISRLDLITCRNVFIYLDNQLQRRVLTRFHYALRPRGVLVLGKAELIPFASKIFEPYDLTHRIYRKDSARELAPPPHERALGALADDAVPRAAGDLRERLSSLGQMYREVLDAIPSPIVVTAVDGSIALWNTGAARAWSRSESEVLGKKITALGLNGFSGELLIEKTNLVREGGDSAVAEGTLPVGGKKTATVNVRVLPLRDRAKQLSGILYLVEDVTTLRATEAEANTLRAELEATLAQVQTWSDEQRAATEELETTNEELQSANEELQTTNEELQSTNEELETTNEELQSSNAELDATNRELAHRTQEMNLLSFYQRTIIRSLSAAVAVLDGNGRIASWNLAAERLLGLPEGEAVGQLFWSLRIPALGRAVVQRIRKALSSRRALRAESIHYELPSGGRGAGTVAAIPLIQDDEFLGAVVLFEDTTRLSALADENAQLKARLKRVNKGRS